MARLNERIEDILIIAQYLPILIELLSDHLECLLDLINHPIIDPFQNLPIFSSGFDELLEILRLLDLIIV